MKNQIVYNAEPFGYSQKAIQEWERKGFSYQEGSWEELDKGERFLNVLGLIVRLKKHIDKKVLDCFPDLQFIVSATTGHDHLDEEEIGKRGLKLYTLRSHKDFLDTIPSTAEHTWALIMALIRKVPTAYLDVKSGFWRRDEFRGYQLKSKTIGIVGLGRTGIKVANYAIAFGMNVKYYDPYVNNLEFSKVSSLEELFSSADIISIHVHLNGNTENMVNSSILNYSKPGSFLINTSRGKIVNEKDVIEAIKNHQLGGIASDVIITELNDIKKSPLWIAMQDYPNIILTPHIGGATWDAMWACEEYIVQNSF